MTFQQFIDKYLGKKIDFDNAYAGQCVDLFRQYCKEVLVISQPKRVAGAADFWTNYDSDPNLKNNFDKIANTPTGIPLKGDVVLWNKRAGGGFGHVAVFISGNATQFTSFDQNWPTLSVCTKTEHGYQNVYGWLHPKVSTPPPLIPAESTELELQKILSHYKVKTADEFITSNDQQLQYLADARSEIAQLDASSKDISTKFSTYVNNLLELINPLDIPPGPDKQTRVVGAVVGLVAKERALQVELKNQQDMAAEAARIAAEHEKELSDQITQVTKKANELAQQVLNLQKQIDKVKQNQETQQTQTAQISAFQELLTKLSGLFKRK